MTKYVFQNKSNGKYLVDSYPYGKKSRSILSEDINDAKVFVDIRGIGDDGYDVSKERHLRNLKKSRYRIVEIVIVEKRNENESNDDGAAKRV